MILAAVWFVTLIAAIIVLAAMFDHAHNGVKRDLLDQIKACKSCNDECRKEANKWRMKYRLLMSEVNPDLPPSREDV